VALTELKVLQQLIRIPNIHRSKRIIGECFIETNNYAEALT
jgi:hypothetical protein